jgi:CBS domain-containing protein
MSQKLRKIMVENVVVLEPCDTVKKAVELMKLHEISCLVVVDSGKPVGILTERDMLNRVINASAKPEKLKVVEVMSKPVVTVSPDMRAGDAAKLMLERSIKKLPLVENGKLVGLVSLTDLLRSEGVVEFLNKVSLNGVEKRMKKVVNLYLDPLKQHRRKCPLIMKDGYSMGCQDKKCMWWTGEECAVTRLSKQLSFEEDSETEFVEAH